MGDCHWACLSNKLCKEGNIVELYDSLHMKLGDTVQERVSTIMNCEAAATTIRVNVNGLDMLVDYMRLLLLLTSV